MICSADGGDRRGRLVPGRFPRRRTRCRRRFRRRFRFDGIQEFPVGFEQEDRNLFAPVHGLPSGVQDLSGFLHEDTAENPHHREGQLRRNRRREEQLLSRGSETVKTREEAKGQRQRRRILLPDEDEDEDAATEEKEPAGECDAVETEREHQ